MGYQRTRWKEREHEDQASLKEDHGKTVLRIGKPVQKDGGDREHRNIYGPMETRCNMRFYRSLLVFTGVTEFVTGPQDRVLILTEIYTTRHSI